MIITQSATGIRTDYTVTPVDTSDWTVLIDETPLWAKGVNIFDSSGQTLELGMCDSDEEAGSEVRQLLIFPGGNGYVKMDIPQGQRISIRAVSADATQGENDLNVIF